MKFFSNEKENEAEYANDDPERTQHVASEPVTVPPQRAGSPWSDRPGNATDTSDVSDISDTDRDRRDEVEENKTTTTTYGPDGTVTDRVEPYEGHHVDETPVDTDKRDDEAAVKDDGSFDSPTAVEPATGEPITDAKSDPDVDLDLEADPKPASEKDSVSDSDLTDSEKKDEPVVAAVPVAAATTPAAATTTTTTGDRLLPDGDAFTERFRDIQLRFVDDPKDATAEASRLVEEVVDQLTSNLKSQRDALGGNADDTEKLRVELRGYREILNRLLSL